MSRLLRRSAGPLAAAGILLFAAAAQAATPEQNRAIRHLIAANAANGPPMVIRGNNLTRVMTIVFALPDGSHRLFFVLPDGRLDIARYTPVTGGEETGAAAAVKAAPPTSPPAGGEED